MKCLNLLLVVVTTFVISEIHSAAAAEDGVDIEATINLGWLKKDSHSGGPIMKAQTHHRLRGSTIRNLEGLAKHFRNGILEGRRVESVVHAGKVDLIEKLVDGIHCKSRGDCVRDRGVFNCEIAGLTDGCSIPYGLPFFYKNQFTFSCNRHDICYGCGVARGLSRSQCDQFFRTNMEQTCSGSPYNRVHPLGNNTTNNGGAQLRNQKLWALVGEHVKVLDTILEAEITSLLKKEEQRTNDIITASTMENNLPFVKRRVILKWLLHLIPFIHRDHSPSLSMRTESLKATAPIVNIKSPAKDGDQDLTETSFHRENYRFYTDILRSVADASDDISVKDMKEDVLYQGFEALVCRFFAYYYFIGVRLFGGPSYLDVAQDECSSSDAQSCLPF